MKNEREFFEQDTEVKVIDIKTRKNELVSLIESVGLSSEFVDNADVWLGYEIEGKLVGCMALERRGELVHIQSLSTDKAYRRRGIAKSLVAKGFNEYLKPGDTMVALTLFWNIGIYEKMGFYKTNAPDMKKRDDVAGRQKHKYCAAMIKEKQATQP